MTRSTYNAGTSCACCIARIKEINNFTVPSFRQIQQSLCEGRAVQVTDFPNRSDITMNHRIFIAAILFGISSLSFAGTGCPQDYLDGQMPIVYNQKLLSKAREVCYTHFGVLHSGLTRTPLWSAEHLTGSQVMNARETERVNAFHEEESLPPSERSNLADYRRSGFDRGHMTPSGDAGDQQSQYDTFTLANMIPQNPDNNRHLWERIESATRNYAVDEGDIYVVTGPLFIGSQLQQINGRVMVPTHIFKAVYDPHRRTAGAYLVTNTATKDYQIISIAELNKMAGFDVFPALPDRVKQVAAELPSPEQRRGHGSHKRKESYGW